MTLTELLNEERDNIKAQFAGADTVEAAQEAMKRALERLLFRFMERSGSDRAKQTAAHLAETVKSAVSMMDINGEPEIWERNLPVAGKHEKKRKVRPLGILLALAGLAVMTGAFVLMMMKTQQITAKGIWEIPAVLLVAAIVLIFCGGIFTRPKKKEVKRETEKTVIFHMDPGKLFRALQAVTITMDRQLALSEEEEKADLKLLDKKEDEVLPKEELELFSGLMEAAMSRDEEYALEKIGDVKYYLHKHDVEAVDHSREHESWFDMLPSEETNTIRPALVSEGKLLVKGLAAGGL